MSQSQGNSPMGAATDPDNPANQPKVELPKVYRTISISFEVGVEVVENYTDVDLMDEAEVWMKRLRIELPITNVTEVI
jgi:hypothetical protein